MLCLLPESNSQSGFASRYLHSSSNSYILPGRVQPLSILILSGCNVINLLYQLDLSLVEIYFIYALKVGQGGQLSMSVQSTR